MESALQRLVEWSDNHTVGEVLAAQGIDYGAACYLVRRGSVANKRSMRMVPVGKRRVFPSGANLEPCP